MTVRDNQRRMLANALRAGSKPTAAQKKQFTPKEIASIRSGLKPVSASVKASRAASLAAGKASLRKKPGVKRAGSNIGRRRGTKISGAGGSAGARESQARQRKYVKKGVGAGKNIKKRRGT